MTRESHSNRAYLLRCWQDGKATPDGKPRWRFSLEEVLHERYRRGFGDLESLLVFLKTKLFGDEDEPAVDGYE